MKLSRKKASSPPLHCDKKQHDYYGKYYVNLCSDFLSVLKSSFFTDQGGKEGLAIENTGETDAKFSTICI